MTSLKALDVNGTLPSTATLTLHPPALMYVSDHDALMKLRADDHRAELATLHDIIAAQADTIRQQDEQAAAHIGAVSSLVDELATTERERDDARHVLVECDQRISELANVQLAVTAERDDLRRALTLREDQIVTVTQKLADVQQQLQAIATSMGRG